MAAATLDHKVALVGALGSIITWSIANTARERAAHASGLERENQLAKADTFTWLSAFGVGMAVTVGIRQYAAKHSGH